MKHSLDKTKMMCVANRQEWRDWLRRHYKSENLANAPG
jgi:hypothetical protein